MSISHWVYIKSSIVFNSQPLIDLYSYTLADISRDQIDPYPADDIIDNEALEYKVIRVSINCPRRALGVDGERKQKQVL